MYYFTTTMIVIYLDNILDFNRVQNDQPQKQSRLQEVLVDTKEIVLGRFAEDSRIR